MKYMEDMEDIEEGMMVFLGLLLSKKRVREESGKNPGDSGNKDLIVY